MEVSKSTGWRSGKARGDQSVVITGWVATSYDASLLPPARRALRRRFRVGRATPVSFVGAVLAAEVDGFCCDGPAVGATVARPGDFLASLDTVLKTIGFGIRFELKLHLRGTVPLDDRLHHGGILGVDGGVESSALARHRRCPHGRLRPAERLLQLLRKDRS